MTYKNQPIEVALPLEENNRTQGGRELILN